MASLITSKLEDKIVTLTLNRPEKYNSVTEPMAEELQEALDDAAQNDKVRCVLLTGEGKAFCAGQDLPEVVDKEEDYELGVTVRAAIIPSSKRSGNWKNR